VTQAFRGDVASSSPAIEAIEFGWTYAGASRPAVSGLSFRLEPGRVLLVLGPSGSGKSTLARAIAGLVPHVLPGEWRGSLRIGDTEVAETPARFLGERVGLVFQDPDSQLVMSRVDDEVAFGLENRGWPLAAMRACVPRTLARVGLAGFEARATNTLSGGEKQRLAIADVLACEPGVLVFDEPTANLDPPGTHETVRQLRELAAERRHTIVLIEHRLEVALPLADDVLLIDERGRQLAFAPAGSVGRDAADLLDRSGAWVPRAWREARPGEADQTLPGAGAGGRAGEGLAPAGQAGRGQAAGREATLLEATGLRVEYPTDESGPHLALDGVALSLRSGERVALVGPNGAGKTTLLLALTGLIRPGRGTVRLRALPRNGETPEEMRDPARLGSRQVASRIGLVFQDPELGFIARTARQEVAAAAAGGDDAGVGAWPDRGGADEVLAHFGLADHADDDPFRLSQGEQRRLSLAALALRPPGILLLDEPTFGLDRRGTEAVLGLLDELRMAGQAQILATHDPRLLGHCDRVVAMDRGHVVFDGPPAAFAAAPPYRPAAPWRDSSAEESLGSDRTVPGSRGRRR
jgi:energy-coupling factor transporter ATP-binding protein EcfA2